MNGWKQKLLTAFAAFWGRNADPVHAQYRALAGQKALMADIALRGGVYTAEFVADPRQAAVNEGRRAIALEILTLAGTEPDELRPFIAMLERNSR